MRNLEARNKSAPSTESGTEQNETKMALSQDKSHDSSSFKLLLLVALVFAHSAALLVGRYTRTSVSSEELYDVNHLIFTCECGKFVLACLLEYSVTKGQLLKSIQENIFFNCRDALKMLVPALLYLVQNSVLFTALSNLSAPVFHVTHQGKLVTTALVSVLMLQRKYSVKQWVCLIVLSVGVAIVVSDDHDKSMESYAADIEKPAQSLALGLVAVTVHCMSSALAGVYFEKVLKKKDDTSNAPPVSVWMRNIQLAFFSLVLAYLQGIQKQATRTSTSSTPTKPYFHGFNFWVWIMMVLQTGGGILVAAVIKYADNVLKGLATGVSLVVATAFSTVVFETTLTSRFSIGSFMILSSVYLFGIKTKRPTSASSGEVTKQPTLPK